MFFIIQLIYCNVRRSYEMKFFSNSLEYKNNLFEESRKSYELWRKDLQEMNKPFFMIPTDFKHLFLKDISGGALKLYLFLGFQSKYYTGESWYTNEEISYFFDKDTRTIATWFKELDDLGLVFRAQKGIKMKANTFLQPYGFFINKEQIYFGKDLSNIEKDVKRSIEMSFNPEYALLLNYGLREMTLVIVYKNNKVYPMSCFFDYEYEDISKIRNILKKLNIKVDNYDLEYPIKDSANMELAIYNSVNKYLDNKKMWI